MSSCSNSSQQPPNLTEPRTWTKRQAAEELARRRLLRIQDTLHLRMEFIPHLPSRRQMEFLATNDSLEVCYGGAAGGGKSDALLMAALQFIDQPKYAAIIFRRTYADLSLPGALLDRSKSWFSGKAHWREQSKQWTFASGATLTFGYLETEHDKYRYNSAEFQYIAFDELTQFTESQYTYLFSRMRKTTDMQAVPLRMRSAAMPGGVGHDWVRARFIDPATAIAPLVAAKLDDNPGADRDGYRRSLAKLDPQTRDQLLHGDWDAGEDAIINYEWIRRCESRDLPPPNPRPEKYIGVDIGRTKDRTVIWTWQKVGDIAWCLECRVLHGASYSEQKDEIRKRIDRWVVKCQIDKGGIGNQLAEELCKEFPAKCVGVQLSQGEQGKLASQMAVTFSEGRARIPEGPEIRSDFRLVKRVDIRNGVAVVKSDRNETGHADRFWAAALGLDVLLWIGGRSQAAATLPGVYVPATARAANQVQVHVHGATR